MKTAARVFILIVILFSTLNAQENIKKGLFRLSGSSGFTYDKFDDNSSSSSYYAAYFGPGFAYMVTNNLELGLSVGYEYSESKTEFKNSFFTAGNSIVTSVSLGPEIRYYFNNESSLIPFIGASFSYNSGTVHGYDTFETKVLALEVGANYFFAKSFALEPAVLYRYQFNSNDQTSNHIRIAIGLNYFIE